MLEKQNITWIAHNMGLLKKPLQPLWPMVKTLLRVQSGFCRWAISVYGYCKWFMLVTIVALFMA